MSPVYINGVEQIVAHKTTHQDTGADEISVAALSGELADRQKSKAGTSVLGWTDEKLLKGAGAGVAPDEIDVPVGPTIVRKTADEIVNNSSILQDDDELNLAVGANEVWYMFFLLRVTSPAAADFKCAVTIPVGSTCRRISSRDIGLITAGEDVMNSLDATTVAAYLRTGVLTDTWILWWAVYVGGANAGDVHLQWAQSTATVGDTQVLANSFIYAHKLG